MKITALVENTTKNPALKERHGLSLYIETTDRRMLFDLGPDDALLDNAAALGVNLRDVDTAVISHGHRDHGGALGLFMELNDRATIYVHRKAFEPHYAKVALAKVPIGLSSALRHSNRLTFVDDIAQIDEDILLFSDVVGQFKTQSNRALLTNTANRYMPDDFTHEQNMILTEGGKAVLFTGCAHRGIVNILRAAQTHHPQIHAVIGGFHLYNPAAKKDEPKKIVQQLAEELLKQDILFYTCHCTGQSAYQILRETMGERLQYLSTGMTLEI